MPEERFIRLQGRLDDQLAPKRREEYDVALERFNRDRMLANPPYTGMPRFDYKGKAPGVENEFCRHHYYLIKSFNRAMFPDEYTDASNPRAKLGCGCEEKFEGQEGWFFTCPYTERELRIDTEEKKIVVRHESNEYVCPYFKPTKDVLAMAAEQLRALDTEKESSASK